MSKQSDDIFELQTARLTLRDLIKDDWHTIFEMSQSTLVTDYQSWLRLVDKAAAQAWI
ncbi:MAG: hypothetical protein AAF639_36185 [Chloroflexota bacterium]